LPSLVACEMAQSLQLTRAYNTAFYGLLTTAVLITLPCMLHWPRLLTVPWLNNESYRHRSFPCAVS